MSRNEVLRSLRMSAILLAVAVVSTATSNRVEAQVERFDRKKVHVNVTSQLDLLGSEVFIADCCMGEDIEQWAVYVLFESDVPGVYGAAIDTGREFVYGLLLVDDTLRFSDDYEVTGYSATLMIPEDSVLLENEATDSKLIVVRGYIRIKKLNSGG
jgi:hypothetical protein